MGQQVRTLLVILGGVVLSVVAPAALDHLLRPNDAALLSRLFTTSRSDPHWPELWHQFLRAGSITVFVVGPLGGIVVGSFIGLLQRGRVALVAATCEVPQFLELLWADHTKIWLGSASGFAVFVLMRCLPFVAAVLSALLVNHIVRRTRSEPSPAP